MGPQQRVVVTFGAEAELVEKVFHDVSVERITRVERPEAFGVEDIRSLAGCLAGCSQFRDALHQEIAVRELLIGADGANQSMTALIATSPLDRDLSEFT